MPPGRQSVRVPKNGGTPTMHDTGGVSTLDEVGEAAGWRCWLCDLPVDPDLSVNDRLGPSIDRCEVLVRSFGKKKPPAPERLAHRDCNTSKGAVKPVVAWPDDIIVFDPAPIIQSVERLMAKGGREVVTRCASKKDAKDASMWLLDRLSRLVPDETFTTRLDEGGGQYLVSLLAERR